MSNKKKPLVLIVDDSSQNLKVLGNILKENGLSTAFALNGTKALTFVKNKQPDLILLDIMMPDISGFEVCKQLKQEAATKDIPVIFLSAKTEKENIIAGLELGAVDYVTKPFNNKELMTRVNTHLELKAAKEELKQKVEQLQTAQEELNQTVEQLKQAYQAAEAANRAKSTFLANMSHELRTPLNGILGYTQIFQLDNSLNKEQQQGINVIHHCGEHLLIMISDILELAKIEAGRMELYPNDFYLKFLLKSSADLFHMRAQQKGIAFNYQQTSHFPQFVHADEKRLRQIIINLLSNAIKFTKQGGVTFKVDYFDEKIRLQVEDTGVGIAPDDMTHIFKPFLQVGDPKYKAEGTGLGLAITKQLVEMMGGELQVESTLGQGSTFWTVLDLPTASAVPLKTTEEAIIIGFEQSPQKILVVDDKWENRTVLVKLLKPLGFEIIEAENGQQAIDKALINHPEAILMDIIMPTMDGLEATNKLKKIPEFSNTIIIALSASAFDFQKQQCMEAGCTDFLAKPVHNQALLEKLQTHLNLKWIYEEEKAMIEGKISPSWNSEPLTPTFSKGLSAEQAATLFEFTLTGDITAIQEYVEQLIEQGDEELQPFAHHLQELADDFKVKKIRHIVQQYMDKST